MRASVRLLIGLSAILSVTGCASQWPSDLPSERYAGMVINISLHSPEADAVVVALRPGGRGLGLWTDETLAQTVSDARGHFVLQTRSGYATTLTASSHDGRLYGLLSLRGHSSDHIVLLLKSTLTYIQYRQGVDPESARAHQAQAAVLRLLSYLSAHPQERLRSLRDYQKLGAISAEDLACFTAEPNLFFGSDAAAQYGFGKHVIVFPNVDAPISFGPTPFPFGPKRDAAEPGKAR